MEHGKVILARDQEVSDDQRKRESISSDQREKGW